MHRFAALAVAALLVTTPFASARGNTTKPINPDRIWKQRWSKASDSEKSWAYATGSCESGNNPATNTGNGYLGAFQFDVGTWWAAPNTGPGRGNAHQLPHKESWKTQAVVSIKKMRRDGTAAW